MPKRKALDVTLADGSMLNLSEREYWDTKHPWQARVRPTSFVMIGSLHLATSARNLAVHIDPNPPREPWETPWENQENRAEFRRMRLGILSDIERDVAPFPSHPLFAELQAAIAAERAGWGYDPATEPEYSNRSKTGIRQE